MDLTIIVPTMNTTGDQTQDKKVRYARNHCLDSLLETTPEDIQIVIASNGGDPCFIDIPTPDARDNSRVKRINIWEQGQCKAVNAAVAQTNTEWVMITNDDQIYFKGWFDRAIFWLKTNKQLMCTSAQLIEPIDGAPTFIKFFAGGAGGDFDKEKITKYVNEVFWDDKRERRYRRGFNFPILVKKELWDLVGGYDIRYDPWGASSDTDLQCKFELAGIETHQNMNWPVYHFSQTSGTFHPSRHGEWQKNYSYFESKWGFERPGDPDVWFSKDLIKYEKLKFNPWWKGYYEKKT